MCNWMRSEFATCNGTLTKKTNILSGDCLHYTSRNYDIRINRFYFIREPRACICFTHHLSRETSSVTTFTAGWHWLLAPQI